MEWNEPMDVMLLKEIAAEGVMRNKYKSQERGKSWEKVAENLNCYQGFSVNAKAVRDRYTILQKKLKSKNSKEKKESGGGGSGPTEAENLLEDLIEVSDETEKAKEQKSEEITKEKEKALEIRQTAMEKLGETKKRNSKDSPNPSKKRRAASDTLDWLSNKAEAEVKLKEQELQQRRDELELQRTQMDRQHTAQIQQQQQFMQFMQLMLNVIQKNN